MDKVSALQSVLKAVNDSVGTNGLVPTLLVYGALPRLGLLNEKPNSSMYQRATSVRKATEATWKEIERTQVREALTRRNGSDT